MRNITGQSQKNRNPGLSYTKGPLRRAIFLDRDGTINADYGYVHKIADWRWLPGVPESLAALKACGWLLLVVSNQSGLGRGYYTREDLRALETYANTELARTGVTINAWYYCPHAPEDKCDCRKPLPGLITRAAREWNVDLAKSWMLGDRLRDMEAGIAAGCRVGMLHNPDHQEEWDLARTTMPQIRIWPDLASAAEAIIDMENDPQKHPPGMSLLG